MERYDLVVIATYNSYLEAEMAKSILESGGIRAEIHNQTMATAYPMAIPSQLLVRESDAEAAITLLEIR